jgi:hypothetical protein
MKVLSMSKGTAGRSFYRNFSFAPRFTAITEGPITFVLLTASPPS